MLKQILLMGCLTLVVLAPNANATEGYGGVVNARVWLGGVSPVVNFTFIPCTTGTGANAWCDLTQTTNPPNVQGTVRLSYGAIRYLQSSGQFLFDKGSGNSMARCDSATWGTGIQVWCANITFNSIGTYFTMAGVVTSDRGNGVTHDYVETEWNVPASDFASGTLALGTGTSYEGQVHANATWCTYGCVTTTEDYTNATFCYRGVSADTACVGNRYANDTFEGQAHANATFCTYGCVTTAESYANATFCYRGTSADTGCVGNRYANGTFEGQPHANATWCPLPACAFNGDQLVSMSYASATYEGQLHANQTWESQIHANATFCKKVGCAFNGPVSAPSLDVGGPATVSDLTVAGAMTTTTSFDPFVAPLVFAGLTVGAVVVGVWGLAQRALAAKVGLVALLVIAAVWSASVSVDANANAFRVVAVVIMSGFALLLAATAKATRG